MAGDYVPVPVPNIIPNFRGDFDLTTGLFVNNPAYSAYYSQFGPRTGINPSTANGYYTGSRTYTPAIPPAIPPAPIVPTIPVLPPSDANMNTGRRRTTTAPTGTRGSTVGRSGGRSGSSANYYRGPSGVVPSAPSGTSSGQTRMGESARNNLAPVDPNATYRSQSEVAGQDIATAGDEIVSAIMDRYMSGEITLAEALAMMQQYSTGGGGGGYSGPSRKQIADAITRMTDAARGAQREIGTAYDTAGGQLDKLLQDYSTAMAGQQAGAGRTLQAFGVDPSQLDVGGMSAVDMIAAQRANLTAQKAAQDASIADRIAAYQTLMGA